MANASSTIAKPFVILRLDGEESQTLGRYATYAQADEAYDYYCNKFPNAWIDIEDLRNLA